MKMINTIKMLSAAAALVFAANASAVVITGPNRVITVTGVGTGHVSVSVVPAVPEAGTWAMMAVGLGLVGLRLRRKNKSDAAA